MYGEGMVSVHRDIVPAVHALSACMERHSYESRRLDTGAYNCRRITGGSGYSLHSYGIALDINWRTNPYGKTLKTDMPKAMIREIKAIRTTSGAQVWRWGGDYSGNKDAMHFEVVASPAELATGIAKPKPVKKPPAKPVQKPPSISVEEIQTMAQSVLVKKASVAQVWATNGIHKRAVSAADAPQLLLAGIAVQNGSVPYVLSDAAVDNLRAV